MSHIPLLYPVTLPQTLDDASVRGIRVLEQSSPHWHILRGLIELEPSVWLEKNGNNTAYAHRLRVAVTKISLSLEPLETPRVVAHHIAGVGEETKSRIKELLDRTKGNSKAKKAERERSDSCY